MINFSIVENGSGGRIETKNSNPVLHNSLITELYIALFGGQTEKVTNGYYETKKMEEGWFGNSPANSSRWINSETENALIGKTITPSMISKLESAIGADLKKFEKYGAIEYSVAIKSRNRIEISIKIEGNNKEYKFVWDGTVNEVILAA